MNNKITISALVAHLALKSGLSKEQSESFVQEFFKIISEALSAGESVKIKALGTFKIMNVENRKSVNVTNGEEIVIPGHKRIVFIPSRELAEEINAPFSMFETVELNPEAEAEIEKEILADQPKPEPAPSPMAKEEKEPAESKMEEIEVKGEEEKEIEANDLKEEEKEVTQEEGREIEENEIKEEEKGEKETDENDIREEEENEILNDEEGDELVEAPKKRSYKFIWGLITGLLIGLIIVGLGYWYFLRNGWPLNSDSAEADSAVAAEEVVAVPAALDSVMDEGVENIDSLGEAPVISEENSFPDTKPSDVVVKDKIGDHYYLTTMAQKHYGNNNLWPYIYMENQDFIGHPDRIKPGTALVVPPLSKYGVDPNNPKDIENAKKLGEEIYKRYR